jgi:ABC-type multidrug transport system fused ATPase/permease subunit
VRISSCPAATHAWPVTYWKHYKIPKLTCCPLSSLDSDTDSLIQSLIRNEFQGRTLITIAHRLNTLVDYDKIAVLDQGRLVEFGSPTVLLARHDSHFSKLLRICEDTDE